MNIHESTYSYTIVNSHRRTLGCAVPNMVECQSPDAVIVLSDQSHSPDGGRSSIADIVSQTGMRHAAICDRV
jgi:hypothetical protein